MNGHRDSVSGSKPLNQSTNGEIDANGITPNNLEQPTSTNQVPFDTTPFRQYLLALLPPVLGATKDDIEVGIFGDLEFEDRVKAWASSVTLGGGTGGSGVLYVAKVQDELQG